MMRFNSTSASGKGERDALVNVHDAHLVNFAMNADTAAIVAHWSAAGDERGDELVIPLSARGVTIQITLTPQSASASLDVANAKDFKLHITVK